MMRSKWKTVCIALLFGICMISLCDIAYAASESYTMITIEATDDESGVYQYAIDSIEEDAWQTSNIFYVLPNTMHTIYVKDAAGNITSSELFAEGVSVNSNMETVSNTVESEMDSEDPYEAGVGAGVGNASVTDYVNNNSKEFYTITTQNGNNFYLIIDHRNSDNNVYFTKAVSELDLLTLAAEAGEVEEAVLEQAAARTEEQTIAAIDEPLNSYESKGNAVKEYLPYIVLLITLCAGYYYFMIYKKKNAAAKDYDEDAADMEQFIPVDDDDDAALFGYKGSKVSNETEEDMDDLINEFYANNSDDEEFEDLEEDDSTGIPDEEIDEVGMISDGMQEDDSYLYDDENQEEV